jgi:hypothetical protein
LGDSHLSAKQNRQQRCLFEKRFHFSSMNLSMQFFQPSPNISGQGDQWVTLQFLDL